MLSIAAFAGGRALGDSINVLVPRAMKVVSLGGYDSLAFDSTSVDTVRVPRDPGFEYGTLASLSVSWGDTTRYVSGTGHQSSSNQLAFRFPAAFVLSNSLRDSLAGEVRTVTLDLSVVRTPKDTAADSQRMPHGWEASRGEVLLHEQVSQVFRFEVGVDSLHFRLLDPPN